MRALWACSAVALAACGPSPRPATADDRALPVPELVDLLARGRLDDAYGRTCPEYREGRDLAAFRAAIASVPYLDGLRDPRSLGAEVGDGVQVDRVRLEGRYGPIVLTVYSRSAAGGPCVAGLEVFGAELLWRAPARRAAAGSEAEVEEGEEEGAPPEGPAVEVMLESQPSEARVFRVDDGFVCETPCTLELPRGREVGLRFELPGHRPEVRTITPERDTVLLVTLEAAR